MENAATSRSKMNFTYPAPARIRGARVGEKLPDLIGRPIKTRSPRRPVRYHLRFQASLKPSAREDAALRRIVKTARIDEVIFIAPHAEERSPGMGSFAECDRAVRRLKPLFRSLHAKGIPASLNIWWTMGFSNFPNFPRDLRSRFPFRWAVSAEGRTSRCIACPRDPAWRRHVLGIFRRFARLAPACLWIDDDVCATLRGDASSPCFCPNCLAEMERRTGRPFSRARLVRAILKDPPNRLRETWLAFQAQIIRDILRELSAAVHQVSPSTRMGVMCSPMETHNAEGRIWSDVLQALRPPAPCLRPHLGPYTQSAPEALAAGFNSTLLAQSVWPDGTRIMPEIDHWPHTRFAKSARCMFTQMALAQLIGIPEITLSINRYAGRPDLERDRAWEITLGESKDFYQAIANLGIAREEIQGVGLFFSEEICRHTRGVSEGALPRQLKRQRVWDDLLPLVGISISHAGHGVTAFGGEQVCCLDAAALERVFSRGALLDARAAECMLRLGQGALVGVKQRLPNARAVLETVEDPRFGRLVGDPVNLRSVGSAWQFRWSPAAREVSLLRGYRWERTGHGIMLFENALGGRVAVLPFDGNERAFTTPSHLNWTRQAQLIDILEWLGRDPLPLVVHEAPMVYPILIRQATRLIVGIANLHSDPIPRLRFTVRKPSFPIRHIHALRSDGRWTKLPAILRDSSERSLSVEVRREVRHLDVAVLRLEGMGCGEKRV